MSTHDFRLLDERSTLQHGLITIAQLTAIGIADSTIHRWVDDGRLQRVAHGVMRVAGAPMTGHATLLAPCLAYGGIASHRSGAAVRRIRGFGLAPPELTVAPGCVPDVASWRVHETDDLDAIAGPTIDGIPCTTPERLATDLAFLARRRQLRRSLMEDAVESLVRSGETDWQRLDAQVACASRERRPGVGYLRDLVQQYLADDAESIAERAFLRLVRAAGLAEPTLQVEIHDAAGFVMRTDCGWPRAKVAAEIDSLRHHLTPEAFQADRSKRNRARLAGWLLLEFTPRQLRDEAGRVVAECARALSLRSLPGN